MWKGDGSLLASSGKDNHVRIFDPRGKPEALSSGIVHNGVKPNRVTWIGTSDNIFTVRFETKNAKKFRAVLKSLTHTHARAHLDWIQ